MKYLTTQRSACFQAQCRLHYDRPGSSGSSSYYDLVSRPCFGLRPCVASCVSDGFCEDFEVRGIADLTAQYQPLFSSGEQPGQSRIALHISHGWCTGNIGRAAANRTSNLPSPI